MIKLIVSNRWFVFLFVLLCFLQSVSLSAQPGSSTRELWLDYLDRVAGPVISNLAEDRLKEVMPIALAPTIDDKKTRTKVAYLEAFGRTLCGIAPWLNGEGGSEREQKMRAQYREWTLKAIKNAVNPESKDYMVWDGFQPLVDASFFAQGLIRSPWIWENLSPKVQQQVVDALLKSRKTIPSYSNWLLFTGMVEAFFCKYGYEYDRVRLDYGFKTFGRQWYTGDGMFSDGNSFNMDFYNSYVIQPYLVDIFDAVKEKDKAYNWIEEDLLKITARYAEIQERSINSDGSFPVIGRSIVYRGGAFHHLANMALLRRLPESLNPSQVRGALTAVIERTLGAPNTFTESGWLNLGLAGHQPKLADYYINTGSLYLCSAIFLPLGLPNDDPFWTSPDTDWTAKKIWSGGDLPADHAMHLN
ncbi:DUF2264 domain-containing protein [Algoriphagus aestuariicola]|uniref:DUF2264 domain-containing protein n=1 Tax=Algoriphagus aestuariicola TaxID=1852016 RepID=A0ABS3BW89_9BACT|nr:DUF2264 domain-containing protein [Algoriphagus aestuariicola]MBN7803332.1 DUF2264 domain-containing protein [Algoriphagus aestuariicola]